MPTPLPCHRRNLKMRCSPTVNVDSLKPFFARAGTPPALGPVSDAGQEGEHEVELLPPGGARRDPLPGSLVGPHAS